MRRLSGVERLLHVLLEEEEGIAELLLSFLPRHLDVRMRCK